MRRVRRTPIRLSRFVRANRQTTIDDVINGLNNDPAAGVLVNATSLVFGQGHSAIGFATQPGFSPFQLGSGKDPTTVQDLVNALNAGGVNLTASFAPASQGGTIIGDEISELSKPVPPGPREPSDEHPAGTIS